LKISGSIFIYPLCEGCAKDISFVRADSGFQPQK
jgi:hypothetical protein